MKKLSLLLASLGLIIAIVGCYVRNAPRSAPRNTTYHELRVLYFEMEREEQSRGKPILKLLTAQPSPGLNASLSHILSTNSPPGALKHMGNADVLVDSWNNPLLVRTRKEALNAGFSEALMGNKEIVIWSAGPNGRDDSGKGDDVVLDPKDL